MGIGIALFVYAVLVRWPYRDVIGQDETFYMIVGRQWLLGLPPYIGAFDVKPPGLFALVALAERLVGPTFVTIKALDAVAVGATGVALWAVGRRHVSESAGWVAGLLYAPATLVLGGVNASAELVASPFVTLAVLIGWGAETAGQTRLLRWAAAGLLMGAAMSVKQTAVFEAAAFGLAAVTRRGAMTWRTAAAFALGCAAVPLAFAAFYAGAGHLTALVDDVALGAVGRMEGDGLTWVGAIQRTPGMLKPIVMLVGAAAVAWAERRRLRERPLWPATRMLAIWLAGAMAGALIVKSMYDHYFLTILPPLCLLTGVGLSALPIRTPRWRLAAQSMFVCAAVAFFIWRPLSLIGPASGQLMAERQTAASLQAFGQRPEDRILVIGWDLGVYLTAHADPPAPIFHQQHLLCPFPQLDKIDPLAAAFANRPAFVVLPAPNIHLNCVTEARRREVAAFVARDYCPLARSDRFTVGDLPSDLTIYGRRARFAVTCAQRASGLNASWSGLAKAPGRAITAQDNETLRRTLDGHAHPPGGLGA